jgi:hypothetical protein
VKTVLRSPLLSCGKRLTLAGFDVGGPTYAPHKSVMISVVMFHKGEPSSENAIEAAATLKHLSA